MNELTNEEAIKNLKKLKSFHNGSYGTAIDMAIQALEQQPCEDCISRQMAIDALGECPMVWTDSDAELEAERAWKNTIKMLKELPSVTPTSETIKEAYEKGYEYGVKDWFEKHTKNQTCIEDYPTCTECEHYDSEKHYCPRFCQVIKDTLAETQPTEECEENGSPWCLGHCPYNTDAQPIEDCISILNRIMEYTYGMLTAEKIGLQHLIKSMMDDLPSIQPKTKIENLKTEIEKPKSEMTADGGEECR